MIDGLFKKRLDRVWDVAARGLSKTGITANQITWIGLGLMVLACLTYQWLTWPWVFGLAILAISAFDSLDGAIARLTRSSSQYGGYLDAILDRYQEIAIYAALGAAHDAWPSALFAMSGALLISYNKARVAVERPIENDAWPDLMERLERTIAVSVGLVLVSLVPWPEGSMSSISALLILLGILYHGTAIQRFLRARKFLKRDDQ